MEPVHMYEKVKEVNMQICQFQNFGLKLETLTSSKPMIDQKQHQTSKEK